MGIFRVIKYRVEDIWNKLCNHWLKTLLCVLVAIAGVTVGVVMLNSFGYNWWCMNRYHYADRLFEGGFALLILFAASILLFYFCLVGCNIHPATRYLSFVVLFVACFYCGANTAAAIASWSLWGVLFAIFVTLVQVVGYLLCCALSLCEAPICRTFKETVCDLKPSFYVLLVTFLLKILGFFVILKIITSVI